MHMVIARFVILAIFIRSLGGTLANATPLPNRPETFESPEAPLVEQTDGDGEKATSETKPNAAPTPPIVKSRTVRVGFQTMDGQEAPTSAELWFTTDHGRTWTKAHDATLDTGAVRCALPGDGEYGLFLVLHNEAGPSSDAPRPGIAPQTFIRVDATSPEVQLLSLTADPDFSVNREVHLRWRAADAAMADRPVAIDWRTETSKTYRRIAEGLPDISAYRWTVPGDVSGRVEIRLTARDRAGNVGQYISDRLLITADGARVRGADDAAADSDMVDSLSADGTERGASESQRMKAGPRRSEPLTPAGEPDAGATRVDVKTSRDAKKRFDLGTYHRLRGEYDLAVVRLREALKLDPNLLDAWHDLGGILILQGRLEDAERAFKTALAKSPQHVPSLRGLALVQARRGDYNSARRTLDAVLAAAPDDVEGLLAAGDVALFSGDRDAAREAWTRAATHAASDPDARRRAEKRLELYPPRPAVAAP
ncbi:MAG: hypothetical protein HBSAPP02_10820 [Phycisphaerae bacterium]|nr:MAG: tetratricopeptide repeat protein [Planctomycetia bacterium]RIK68390.1 MAG: hypothetical protein DCC66_10565 [Planctomycetota bacterium]GJQ26050.1 MAG: hypothetical protein HBSAPP02_10820 [Phycisphaerae bacterium]